MHFCPGSNLKGTIRGLSGVFLPLVMKPLCPLKYYDRSITSPWSLLGVVSLVHYPTCPWVNGLPWPI